MVTISNIQHFSVGDGPGIRTTVFFKGCNLHCPWCHNPENLTGESVVLTYKATGKTETLGKTVTTEELLPELLEDRDFYLQSGGGVTFSGGEVMLQAASAAELAGRLKENGVPVLIDTAGCVAYRQFSCLNPVVDGYLFDFKTADSKKYEAIGGDLALVTENIRKLLEEPVELHIRIPLIPGFNTDEASISAMGRHLKKLGIHRVELLPFHRLGSGKYEAMGLAYTYAKTSPLTRQQVTDIQSLFQKEGLQTICEE